MRGIQAYSNGQKVGQRLAFLLAGFVAGISATTVIKTDRPAVDRAAESPGQERAKFIAEQLGRLEANFDEADNPHKKIIEEEVTAYAIALRNILLAKTKPERELHVKTCETIVSLSKEKLELCSPLSDASVSAETVQSLFDRANALREKATTLPHSDQNKESAKVLVI
jgi:hypothetical protein